MSENTKYATDGQDWPEGLYEGYIWWSDEKAPRLIEGLDLEAIKALLAQHGQALRWIEELMLYHAEGKLSFVGRRLGTKLEVHAFSTESAGEDYCVCQTKPWYLARSGRKMQVLEIWKAEDALTKPSGLEVKQMRLQALVFGGFVKS